MLITFKSKAAAEVIMYKEHAKHILDLFHKDVARGVITAAETAPLLAILEKEIAAHKVHSAADDMARDIALHHGDEGDDNGHESPQPVSFATRAYPLLEMLRAANVAGKDVMWGV
jgi:hypothetical protein